MTALVLVAPGSEEIETVAIVDTLVRGGIEVVLASCGPTGARQICASRGVQIVADCHLDELTTCDFELIVVPGGLPGSEVIRDTPLAIDLLREQAALGRWLRMSSAGSELSGFFLRLNSWLNIDRRHFVSGEPPVSPLSRLQRRAQCSPAALQALTKDFCTFARRWPR